VVVKRIAKFFAWLIGIILALEVVGIIVAALSKRISPHTVLTVRIEGEIPEQAPRNPFAELVAGRETTFTDIVEGLERARTDPRITGVEMHITESGMNMAKLQDLRGRIQELNRAGKFSVAYLEFATNRSYYLASACQRVFLLPSSDLYVRGMMASSTFFRGALDKLGVYPDLYHIGDYKNATNVYTEKKYTQAHREATQSLVEDWYHEFLRGVAEGRGMRPEEAEAAIQRGPFTSQEALAARLVDKLAYADEARDFVEQKNHGSHNRLSLREYLRRTEREGRSKLAIIYATGMILPGRSGNDPFGGSVIGSDTIAEQFRRARDDSSIKAVVLRVDSPGGVSFSSEAIRREVEMTKRSKPVVASMSDVAASGGYWISMSADKIVAEPGTLTGSIGVVTGKFNLRGLYDKLGLSKDYVATTENSTLEWPYQNFTPAQRQSVEKTMRDVYENFLRGVAEGRHMDVKAVDKIGQGRVWTGERAWKLGLVDELGGFHAAIARARELAKIPSSEKVGLVYLPPPKSFFDAVFELLGDARAASPAAALGQWLGQIESLARQPVWALLPDVPEVE